MTVGNRIKTIRETLLNLSQTELANKIGVSKQTLYKYENGIVTNIPSDKIEAIAKLAHITPSYLMGWDTDEDQQAAEAGTTLGKAAKDPDQIKLLKNYQSLDAGNRARLLDFSDALTLLP